MYKTILVNQAIEDGKKLLRKLEQQRFPFEAAFWHYDPESMRWRLYIASRFVEKEGPTKTYTRIQKALVSLRTSDLFLSDISVVSPDSAEFRVLRNDIVHMGSHAAGKTKAAIKDLVFEDAYVYTLH